MSRPVSSVSVAIRAALDSVDTRPLSRFLMQNEQASIQEAMRIIFHSLVERGALPRQHEKSVVVNDSYKDEDVFVACFGSLLGVSVARSLADYAEWTISARPIAVGVKVVTMTGESAPEGMILRHHKRCLVLKALF